MPTTCHHCGHRVDAAPEASTRDTVSCPECDRPIDLADTRDTNRESETAATDGPNNPALDFQTPDDPDDLPGGSSASDIPSFDEPDATASTDAEPETSAPPRTSPQDRQGTPESDSGAEPDAAASSDRTHPADLDVDLPDRIELREETDGLHIVRHWNTWYALLYGPFTAFLLFLVLSKGGEFGPLGMVGVVVFLYLTLCELLNETHVQIEPPESDAPTLSVEHGPLPWWPLRLEMPANDVEQLYVAKNTYHIRRRNQDRFSLQAEVRGRLTLSLMKRLRSPDEAEAVERLVESYLAIDDEPVPGEYDGESTGWF